MSVLDRQCVAVAFGAILRTARLGAGISQEALAERADFDRTYTSLLERGLRTPTLSKLIDIAEALGIEPSALVAMTVSRLRRDKQS
jgi:transcriptional regulator with XRE-family HTH domain